MATLISILTIIAAILLILAVLIQQPKGSGLAANFSSATMLMGVKRTTEFIEKFTWGTVIVIMLLAASSNAFVDRGETTQGKKAINNEQLQNVTLPSNAPAPAVNSTNPVK